MLAVLRFKKWEKLCQFSQIMSAQSIKAQSHAQPHIIIARPAGCINYVLRNIQAGHDATFPFSHRSVMQTRLWQNVSPPTIKRLITYLNTPYKWFTTCFLYSNSLMQEDSRGAKKECGGRWIVCLQIARFFMQDRYKQNLSTGWINVRKAYDSVDHLWLRELFAIHRFQEQIGRVVYILGSRWNTRIVVRTKQGVQTSDHGKNALRKVLVTQSTSNLAYRVKVEIKRKSTNFLSTSMNFQPACVATVHTFIVFR